MPEPLHLTVDPYAPGTSLDIGRYGLGQGGMSQRPMFQEHVEAIRNLRPKVLRLFLQEYFDLYPEHGVYHWDTLDTALSTAAATGAGLLLAICIKPRVLYPRIDQNIVHPNNYQEWEELIYQLVRHCKQKHFPVEYWEVFNEPNAGETGGCPSLFTAKDYCIYYEHTVRAVLRADSAARVGGPATLGFDPAYTRPLLEHCRQHKLPIHFVSWHTYRNEIDVFRDRMRESRKLLAEFADLKCQNFLDEWNISLQWDRADPAFHACSLAEITWQMLEHGIDAACYYHIRDYHPDPRQFETFMSHEGTQAMHFWWNQAPYYGGLFDFQGTIRPNYFLLLMLSRLSGNRIPIGGAGADAGGGVKGIATWDAYWETLQVMLWNYDQQPPPTREVTLDIGRLAPGKWSLRRFRLDTSPGLSDENERLRVMHQETFENRETATLTFTLEPYGVTLVTAKRLSWPREVPAD